MGDVENVNNSMFKHSNTLPYNVYNSDSKDVIYEKRIISSAEEVIRQKGVNIKWNWNLHLNSSQVSSLFCTILTSGVTKDWPGMGMYPSNFNTISYSMSCDWEGK